ncbi:protein kinase C-binding protein NELL1-like isoform X4 [Osmia bicornis bicornis]|uniref:protein kinase C-binding protein NELL1-like isoform X4 n=1 Tax=Osmia bicornis bicornis TaxID=1437191 RepID=UPI001EAF197C|nr:protein kinase C-binding protein NELL1-like isoform X4 [Osmia bicornis bicornis]
MYYGSVIDRTGSSCSPSDLQQPRSPRRRAATTTSGVPKDVDADQELLFQREEPAYVVLDVQPRPGCAAASCHAGQRPARRRTGGNAIRIFLLAALAAFLAIAVSPVSGTTNKKEEAAAEVGANVGVTKETSGVPATRPRTGSDPGGCIDLLAALQLHNTTDITLVKGLNTLKPAYYLHGEERELRLNQTSFERAVTLLRRVPEFTIAAALKQEETNSGTIVAFSHGNNKYLELQSSGRKNELRLHYVSRRDGKVHEETFPFRLADGTWHRVALSVSGSQVELLVDCHPLYRRLLRPGPPDTNFTLPELQLWVGQRNVKHFLFKGALQDVKLIPGPHGYLSQCPQLDSSCPTCGQFSILQNTIDQLMHNLNELSRRLAAAEGRISRVEECECQKSCRANGTVHEDGATWEKGCQQCSCVHGEIECRPTPCAAVTCKNPVIPQGQCCPICLKQCYLHGVIYDHGEKVSPKQCVECDCFDGSFTCQRFDTETRCPPLPCPPSEQISVAEECCKFCPDIDECKQQGGSEGHHCNANTKCVNVIGSYTCECLPGYHRVDKFNCAELDECATGHHTCDQHATCVNTAGSYYCICKDGYTGDGYTCKPVCNQTCQNGGECVAPGKCSCRRGYIGNSCELDLDECASDLHRCHQSSTCFNMPGWYYCRCKPGYRSALHDSTQGTQCLDIDECNDQTIERRHTCHPSAKCVNTEGGYECVCPPQEDNHTAEECRLSCLFENQEVKNGETLAPAGNPCRRCTCKDGVITCRDPVCDCSAPGSHRDKCCPQCDPAASCRHQELHHLVFRSGERWIYQCQTCECLYGEIDCWQMECPPVSCSNPVTEDGDCCPRCEDDPCARELPGNGTSLSMLTRPRPCSYSGIVHDSGSSWQDPHDKCTTCECKVPYCAQLVSNSACCVHRTGSYAAATITAALAIWAATSSNVLQSLFLSLTYAAYRALRGHRWLTVHRKQLYQRLQLPAQLVQRSPAPPTPCHPRLLPRPPTPEAGPTWPGKHNGACKNPSSQYNDRGTTSVSECNYNKLCLQTGTSCPLEQRRRRRRRTSALHPRRRRRRRRAKLRASLKRLRLHHDDSALKRRATSPTIEATHPSPLLPQPRPHPPPPRRLRRHLPCWCPLGRTQTRKTLYLSAAPPATATTWSGPTDTVGRRTIVIGGATTTTLWRGAALPEPVASVES